MKVLNVKVYASNDNSMKHFCTLTHLIGLAKQAPHWGVQSRFRVLYKGMSVVCQINGFFFTSVWFFVCVFVECLCLCVCVCVCVCVYVCVFVCRSSSRMQRLQVLVHDSSRPSGTMIDIRAYVSLAGSGNNRKMGGGREQGGICPGKQFFFLNILLFFQLWSHY